MISHVCTPINSGSRGGGGGKGYFPAEADIPISVELFVTIPHMTLSSAVSIAVMLK